MVANPVPPDTSMVAFARELVAMPALVSIITYALPAAGNIFCF